MKKSAKEKNLTKNIIALALLIYGVLIFIKGIRTIFGGSLNDAVFCLVYCVEGTLMSIIGLALKYMVVFKK